MENIREVLKIVVVGHVDHGKSTLIGRLLYDTKSLPEGAIDRVKRICKEKGMPFEYAFLLDAFEEEQKQGITIDTTQLKFHTKERDYIIIDAPGHKEFLKNMISGAASAEAAFLVIDALEGVQEQSKRHGYILSLLGIKKVYVVINKMDLINYSEEKFNIIRQEINKFLNGLNVFPVKFIPVSAFLGKNITKPSQKISWYKEEPVLEVLDLIEKDKEFEDKALRFPIQDVYKFDNRRIIAGRIETGTLKTGDEILISPSNKVTRVKTIEYWLPKDKKEYAKAGESIGITVEDEFFNKRGEIISHKINSPLCGNFFKANLFWLGKTPLIMGKKYKVKLVTQEVECEIHSIIKVIDAATLETVENTGEVKINDVAEVIFQAKHKICFDTFQSNQLIGRFVIVDGFDVSGGGIITGIESDKQAVNRLVKGNVEMITAAFDEYYFIITEGVIKPEVKNAQSYDMGDIIPIKGETYSYPGDFNIIDLHLKLVAKIRDAELVDIISLEDFEYDYFPVINKMGFSASVYSQKSLESFKEDFSGTNVVDKDKLADFANKWFDIGKYKSIKYK